jgi:uncharacterized protein
VIFVDTGAFLARYIERDQHHAAAVATWSKLAESSLTCFTSNLVISETLTLLARRTDYRFAAERARQLYSSNALQVLRPELAVETAAVVLLEKFADQKVSFCDCVSMVLMQRARLRDVFTFDGHFKLAGFNVRP